MNSSTQVKNDAIRDQLDDFLKYPCEKFYKRLLKSLREVREEEVRYEDGQRKTAST